MHGHLLAVVVGAWAVWEGSTEYIPNYVIDNVV